jgi:hypothetical protein
VLHQHLAGAQHRDGAAWSGIIARQRFNDAIDAGGERICHAGSFARPPREGKLRRRPNACLCRLVDQRGGIVGHARLTGVIRPCTKKTRSDQISLLPSTPCTHTWHIPDQYAFVLEDVRPTRFVPLKGMPGFFNVPDDIVVEALRAA